jgi:arginine decarboxylase
MAVHGAELWRHAIELADWARDQVNTFTGLRCLGRELLQRDGVSEYDPTRLTVSACELGLSGYQLETVLRDDYRIAVEAADPLNIVLNVTFGDSREDVEQLAGALRDLSVRYADGAGSAAAARACSTLLAHTPPFTRQVLSPRDAVFAAAVAKPLGQCAGEVSADMVTPYPPGIPVLGPGEAISPEIVAYLREASASGLKVHGPEDRTLRSLRVVA